MKHDPGICIVAYHKAEDQILSLAKERFLAKFVQQNWRFSDASPSIIYFASGGSEMNAIKLIVPARPVLLLAFPENNALAAASEVKAWCDQKGCKSAILNLNDPDAESLLSNYLHVLIGINKLKGQRLGLIGHESDWLVASKVSGERLQELFGIQLIPVPWDSLPGFDKFESPPEMIDKYPYKNQSAVNDAGKIYELLKKAITEQMLNAISVECFSLVKSSHVTACLALSHLNDLNIPAGCEGDLTSSVGMMICKEISGQIPWMANLADLNHDGVLFAHCTAPTEILKSYKVDTHFETGLGTAVRGSVRAEQVTVIRFDNRFQKMFIATGKVSDRPNKKEYCRTQLEVELEGPGTQKLKESPLGNHHLILPGDHEDLFRIFARLYGLQVI